MSDGITDMMIQEESLKRNKTKSLSEIVRERADLQEELAKKTEAFQKERGKLTAKIGELQRLEGVACDGLDVKQTQIAERLLSVSGDVYGKTSDVSKFNGQFIAECAIEDIANGCVKLESSYFGNKRYEHFYQRCDCQYGYGPSHGSIVDRIELRDTNHSLTEEEKNACIYYLRNYPKIKEASTNQ